MLERDIQRACLDYLTCLGWFVWRQNQGVIPNGKGGFRRFNGMPGQSDIIGVLPQTVETVHHGKATFGNFLAVEVKRPGKRQTPAQEEFLRRVNENGGVGIVVTSVDDLTEKLQPFLAL